MQFRQFFMGAAVLAALGFTACQQMPNAGGAGAIQAAPVTEGDDITGTVTGDKGPEAGVWVIAETRDLPTPFWKVVVTDDQGRFAVPDLPKANYAVWVRGYGLVD